MDRRAVHNSIYDFEVGDTVLLKKDFDNNKKTKKKKLESFYHKESIVIEILFNNRVKLNLEANEVIVDLNLIRK
jgi:hypothetical protein